jgi:undecaprenyl-phosphate galactose phosphotransferase
MEQTLKNRIAYFLNLMLPVFDLAILVGCFWLAFWIRFVSGYHHTENPFYYRQTQFLVLTIMGLVWLGIFQAQRLYNIRVFVNRFRQTLQVLKGVTIGTLVYIFLSYILKTKYMEESRLVIGYAWLFSFLGLCLFRCLLFRPVFLRLAQGTVLKKVLIAGAGRSGARLAQNLLAKNYLGVAVAGFVDDDEQKIGRTVAERPVLGRIDDINVIVHDHGIEEVYVAINAVGHQRLLEIINSCRETKVPVQVISDLYNVITSKIDVEELEGIPMVEIKDKYVEDINLALKRLMDVIVSLVLLVVLLPVFLLVAVLIKATSSGPVLFKQVRIGKNGRRFNFYKFRTMVANADAAQHKEFLKQFIDGKVAGERPDRAKVYKITNDARVTKIGALLRRTSIDEFPQLLNVLRGEMSLVGPRPSLPYEFDNFKAWHKRRFNVLPGMTGLWQVSGRSSVKFNDMIMLDLYYIENMSIWFDIQIILKTLPAMFAGRGAF